jgi:hypothetical protein
MTDEKKEKIKILQPLARYLVVFFAGYAVCMIQYHCNYNNDVIACDMPTFELFQSIEEQVQ